MKLFYFKKREKISIYKLNKLNEKKFCGSQQNLRQENNSKLFTFSFK